MIQVHPHRFLVPRKPPHNYGHGVTADEVEWLFSKYVRGSAELQGKGIRGSGLGLFICKRIAQAHGGDVRLMPEREGARVFELRIGIDV